jgi:hypothetical protein
MTRTPHPAPRTPHLRTLAPPHRRTAAPSHRRTAAPPHCVVVVGAFLALAASAAQAHHSIAGVYDNRRPVTIDGVVIQFQFVRPHPFLDLRDTRTSQTWRLEMDNLRELSDIGFTAETLKSGDRLVVTGSPGRRQANTMYIERLERPADGFGYEQYNSRPRLRQRSR